MPQFRDAVNNAVNNLLLNLVILKLQIKLQLRVCNKLFDSIYQLVLFGITPFFWMTKHFSLQWILQHDHSSLTVSCSHHLGPASVSICPRNQSWARCSSDHQAIGSGTWPLVIDCLIGQCTWGWREGCQTALPLRSTTLGNFQND